MFGRIALIVGMIAAASPAFAQQAQQQQPTQQEVIDALAQKVDMLQREMDRLYLAGARATATTGKITTDAEAQKATLIEWLKAAQAAVPKK